MISIVSHFAAITIPHSIFQTQVFLDFTTIMASFATWVKPINLDNLLSMFPCHVLQSQHKRIKGKIGYFFAPKHLHSLDVQILKAKNIILPYQ
jgi:hypothetical protein